MKKIEEWWKAVSPEPPYRRGQPPKFSGQFVPGIWADSHILRERDGTRIGEVLRFGDDALFRLVLPNPATIARHRIIRDSILRAGGQVVTVPVNVLEAADIVTQSVQVVASKPSVTFFRAHEQVIKAKVTYRGVRDWATYSTRWLEREAYFLAGYDQNEPGLSYFFCELPPGVEPKTVDEAYASLKPESVKTAEKLGRKVKRQGDMFFIRMKDFDPGDREAELAVRLHRSNHVADEGIFVHPKNGSRLLYVRGTMKHVPFGRRPDHKPLKLGTKHWWLCVRNTVPLNT